MQTARVGQDILSEDTIIISDPENEVLLSSEHEAPPPKWRQIGRACKPSNGAASANMAASDQECEEMYAPLQAKLSMAKGKPRQRAPASLLRRLQVRSMHVLCWPQV